MTEVLDQHVDRVARDKMQVASSSTCTMHV